MNIQGFTSRGCGGGRWDAGWALPGFVRNSSTKMTRFMGADAYSWYKALEDSEQELFINAMGNAKY